MNSTLELVDYKEISELTGQSITHLHALQHRGVLPPKAHHRAAVWLKEDILRWIRTDPRATPSRKNNSGSN